MKKLLLLLLLPLLFASACTTDHGYFPVVSNRNVDLKNYDPDTAQKVGHVRGRDRFFAVFVVPFGESMNPTIDGALDDCFRRSGADLLTNVHIYQSGFWIPIIYYKIGIYVEADAVKIK